MGPSPTIALVEREEALASVPEIYGRSLALRDQGFTLDEIAAAIGVVAESVQSLLAIAESKLNRLLETDSELPDDDRTNTPGGTQ